MEGNYFKLNDTEKGMIRPICDSFNLNHNSSDRKISADEIVKRMKKAGYPFNERVLRKIIGYVRYNNLLAPYFILSDRDGYWLSDNHQEIERFYHSLRKLALSILSNIKACPQILKGETKDDKQLDLFSDIFENV